MFLQFYRMLIRFLYVRRTKKENGVARPSSYRDGSDYESQC